MRVCDSAEISQRIIQEMAHYADDSKFQNAFRGGLRRALRCLNESEALDVVPVDELITLRDDLYESDQITMKGLAQLNALIAKYERSVS